MRIDKRLNLVIPIQRDDGTIFIHSSPIGKDVFDLYFEVMGRAFTRLMTQMNVIAGPGLALNMLMKVAKDAGPAVEQSIQNGLIAEIRRLTNVVLPTPTGWQTMPFDDAIKQDQLSPDDVSEAENAIVFFILISAIQQRQDRTETLTAAADLWHWQLTSLDSTAWKNSLPISTATATSPASEPAPVLQAGSSLPR